MVDIGLTTSYKLIQEKKLKVVKIGRSTLVTDDEHRRFMASLVEEAA